MRCIYMRYVQFPLHTYTVTEESPKYLSFSKVIMYPDWISVRVICMSCYVILKYININLKKSYLGSTTRLWNNFHQLRFIISYYCLLLRELLAQALYLTRQHHRKTFLEGEDNNNIAHNISLWNKRKING